MKSLPVSVWLPGAAPLTIGTVIFILWLLLRADVLVIAGAIVIGLGLVSVVIGAVSLIRFLRRSLRSGTVPRHRLARQGAAMACLLLMNFVAAASFVCAAYLIETCYILSITNGGTVTTNAVEVNVGAFAVSFGDISPGETKRRRIWIRGEGQLVLAATRGGERIEGVVDEYVTTDLGGGASVFIDPNGDVAVRRR